MTQSDPPEAHDRPAPAGAPDEPGLKLRLEKKLGWLGALRLVPYWGHGTSRSLHLRGRLIEAKGEAGSVGEKSGLLKNVITTLRRMESDEIPGARLRARFRGREHELFTDAEGYFQLNLYTDEPLEPGWHRVPLELVDSVDPDARAEAEAEALVPGEDAEFAVVSDLDDTVIRSSATDTLEQARLTLFHDAASRMPFPGVGALYHGLGLGPDRRGINPVFYVSRSGWNLYDLFVEFFELHDLPRGPMFLRDLALKEKKSSALGSEHHKLSRIRELLQLYPRLPFVLVGDSGQGDLAAYRQIVVENPDRVRAVYVRSVTGRDRDLELEALAEDLRRRGVPTLLAQGTPELAEHMRLEGLISGESLDAVGAAEEEG